MLFQGQEFGATTPFLYFCDHKSDLGNKVYRGRKQFLAQFPSLSTPVMQDELIDPGDPDAYPVSKLDWSEIARNDSIYTLHKDLIRLRQHDPVFRSQLKGAVDGAVLSSDAFLLRLFGDQNDDRLIVVNLGRDLHLDPAPEPLLAPPSGMNWAVLWSSEDPRYGGGGTVPPETGENWRISGNSAIVLRPRSKPGRFGMTLPVRVLERRHFRAATADPHLNEEWLVTNGLGGYASGTVAGALTRRYHGLLIAALPNPLGRTMMLNALSERIRLRNRTILFTGPTELTGIADTLPPSGFHLA